MALARHNKIVSDLRNKWKRPRIRENVIRFDKKRLLRLCAAALLLALPVLVVRGCFMARTSAPGQGATPEHGAAGALGEGNVLLFDENLNRTVSLPLEEYLVGVVAAEMPASFEPEALMAQAVAARTYAARRMAAYGGAPCGKHGAELCTDSACCQAYRSEEALRKRWGESAELYLDKIRSAVEATAGQVLVYRGELIEALFHSNSGGRTEAAADVFGGSAPYLQSVLSPGEEAFAHYRDTVTLSEKAFVSQLNEAFPKAKLKVSTLERSVEILERSEGGRVTKLKLGKITVTGRQLRAALDLPSAAFSITFSGGEVRIDTRGYGHGVGMSQYGANAMAQAGQNYQAILTHYYTGVTLCSLDELG